MKVPTEEEIKKDEELQKAVEEGKQIFKELGKRIDKMKGPMKTCPHCGYPLRFA